MQQSYLSTCQVTWKMHTINGWGDLEREEEDRGVFGIYLVR